MNRSEVIVGLSELPNLDFNGLVRVWRKHLSDKVPANLPKSLLIKLLAYQLQVEQLGGLSRSANTYLKALEADLLAGRSPDVPLIEVRKLKPGSVLVREHEGVMYRAMVLEQGFSWQDKSYASLSAVAKAITGTNWNGYRFFGLKDRQKTAVEAKS